MGYVSSGAALLLTGLRPALRAYQYIATRLSMIRQQIKYPREDVCEVSECDGMTYNYLQKQQCSTKYMNTFPNSYSGESSMEQSNKYSSEKTHINKNVEIYQLKLIDKLSTIKGLKFAAQHDLGLSPLIYSLIQFIVTLFILFGLLVISLPLTNLVIPYKGLAILLIMLAVLLCYLAYCSVRIAYKKYRISRSYLIEVEAMLKRVEILSEDINNLLDIKYK